MILKIAIVEDNAMYSKVLEHALTEEGYQVEAFGSSQDFLASGLDQWDIISLDHSLPDQSGMELLEHIQQRDPDLPVIYLSGQEEVEVVVEAYDKGAFRYIIKNDSAIERLKAAIKKAARTVYLKQELEVLKENINDRSRYSQLVGESSALLNVLKLIQRVEKTDTQVLITGDSGTGKELVALAIHENSPRKKKPFVAVNMAAIPDHLLEDELFGHEKGAFTGASSRRKGRFEEAQGGTIFLDEIGEMELKLQAKMLRVLQEKKMSRLGSNKEIRLDVRVIAATNRNLSELVKQGGFREDLYYRIQGFLIHMPRLKDRGDDILLLAKHFLAQAAKKHGAGDLRLDKSAEDALQAHEWPGNVRELMALIDRSVLMRENDLIKGNELIFSSSI